VSAARHTPPLRSHSAWALVAAGDAAGVTDRLEEHPTAAIAAAKSIGETSQLCIGHPFAP